MQCSENVKYYTLLWSITFQKKKTKTTTTNCSANFQTQKPGNSDDDEYSMLQYLLSPKKAHLLSSSGDDG